MYTGRHQENREYMKHSHTNDYYLIYHPLRKNITTGNACIRIKDVRKYNKNFIFQYLDDDLQLKTIMIGRRQVCDHLFPFKKYNIETKRYEFSSYYYLIKISDIFQYGQEINI